MAAAKALDALALVGIRLLAGGVVWSSGFRAISDDDYARVVIAQQFASAPQWDPSGTSWLPFPFWLQGVPMLLFGSRLETAQVVAWLSGIASTLLVWHAANWLGLDRRQAFLGAAVASVFPYSARLGVATVPEQLTAGLVLLGAASLATTSLKRRTLGALALVFATLSRYETWPVAASFGAFCLWDAVSMRRKAWLGPALLAGSGVLLWLLHGAMRHGDMTFFVKRVQDYQQALGGSGPELLHAVTRHPSLVLRHEPELVLLAAFALVFANLFGVTHQLVAFKRALCLMLVLLGFLILGDLRSTGATHHPERTLLPVWVTLALVSGALWPLLIGRAHQLRTPVKGALALLVTAAVAVTAYFRPVISSRAAFTARSDEVSLGRQAREVAGEGQLLIVARDYGFFAIMAAFGEPARATAADDKDPRRPRSPDPFSNPAGLERRLQEQNVRALIAPRSHAAEARRLGRIQAATAEYLLIAIEPPRTAET